ncbi:MAG: hypothetical protein J7647_00225 [Cyanobacteria bacterium SBLK]|nr:hypothetical protein [Cyanobacteria bacterium SBLK]
MTIKLFLSVLFATISLFFGQFFIVPMANAETSTIEKTEITIQQSIESDRQICEACESDGQKFCCP